MSVNILFLTNSPLNVTNNTLADLSATWSISAPSTVVEGVQWQLSDNDGATWFDVDPTGVDGTSFVDLGEDIYESEYTTSPLNSSNNGRLYRIVITTNDDEFISDSIEINIVQTGILVVQDEPTNLVNLVSIGQNVQFVASAYYFNRNSFSDSDVDPINIRWEFSPDFDPTEEDPINSASWFNVTGPAWPSAQTFTIIEQGVDTGQSVGGGQTLWVEESRLTITNINFSINGYYFRAVFTSTGVNNSPIISNEIAYIIVSPEITITRQPGFGPNDSQSPVFSFNANNPSNSGNITLSVAAATTRSSSATLNYNWQVRVFNDGVTGNRNQRIELRESIDWINVSDLNNEIFVASGFDSPNLQLSRCVYFDRYEFRCEISGEFELPVITDSHTIYMISTNRNITSENLSIIDINEDFYGDIVDRQLFTDKVIRNILFSGSIDVTFYLGQDGETLLQWQKRKTTDSDYVDIGDPVSFLPGFGSLFDLPTTTLATLQNVYATIPLRIDQGDDLALYRLKALSGSNYVFDNSQLYPNKKSFIEWYSGTTLVNLYREIFIVTEPSSVDGFVGSDVSFTVTTQTTSSPETVTVNWQYATSVNGPWINLNNGPFFGISGQNVISNASSTGSGDSALIISNVTSSIATLFFRSSVNVSKSLGSVTSIVVRVNIIQDNFTEITTINDIFANEFTNVEFSIQASSASLQPINFKWQRSTNFVIGNPGASNWTDINDGQPNPDAAIVSGSNTNTLILNTIRSPFDAVFYRCRLTSFGGEVTFTNEARIIITTIAIAISKNLPNTLTYVENESIIEPLEIIAAASTGEDIFYQWQFRKPGDSSFSNFTSGDNFSLPTASTFTPLPFSKNANWDNALVRVQMRINSFLPGVFTFSNSSTLDIRRRFFYFADVAVKSVENGSSFRLDLNPDWTGIDNPTYQWQYSTNGGSSWNSITLLGAVDGLSELFIPTVTNSQNGYLIRCRVNLNLVDDFVYTRNNIRVVQDFSANNGFGFTQTVQIQVVSKIRLPAFYSKENGKTGATIGTVICVAKPPDYTNSITNTDDISLWGVSVSGGLNSSGSDTSSVVTSGNVFNDNRTFLNRPYLNQPNWVASGLRTPKWRFSDDRFPGFIELRGQWLLKSEFPLLYKIIGDRYGSTATKFRLPNPYAKKMMGTGSITSSSGRTSVVPLYSSNLISGGDVRQPGTIGGVYLYERSRQLPPGSPGTSNSDDGTAGSPDPATFSIGSYSTVGWEDSENIAETTFTGDFSFSVGPIIGQLLGSPPPHEHRAIAVGFSEDRKSSGSCREAGIIGAEFWDTRPGFGVFGDGPAGVSQNIRGRVHSHGLAETFISSRGGSASISANRESGKGDTSAATVYTAPVIVHFDRNNPTRKSLNSFLENSVVRMSRASRTLFDNNLSFTLRNAEQIPINASYFRVKWLIKAY